MKLLQEVIVKVEEALSSLQLFRTSVRLSKNHEGYHYLGVEFFVRSDAPLADLQNKEGEQYRTKIVNRAIQKFKEIISEFEGKVEDRLVAEKINTLREDFLPILLTSISGFVTQVKLLLYDDFFNEAIQPDDIGTTFEGNHIVFVLGFCVEEDYIDKLKRELSQLNTAKWDESDFLKGQELTWTAGHKIIF